jgi:uracil permease
LTKREVPVVMGSSFIVIPAISQAFRDYGELGVRYAQFGIICMSILFMVFAILMYFVGAHRVTRLFPPAVTGSIIIVIGIGLAYSALNDIAALLPGAPGSSMSFYHTHSWASWLIALIVLSITLALMVSKRGFLSKIPILIGMVVGYVICLIAKAAGANTMDWGPIVDSPWLNLPWGQYYLPVSVSAVGGVFTLPAVHWTLIVSITPLAIISFMEHIGDMTSLSAICDKPLLEDPGVHRTLCADAVASALSGFLGGPEITTYSENTGVLIASGNKDPRLLRLMALFAIGLGLFGKFGGVVQAMPNPVKGAASLFLFGMIGAVGVQTLLRGGVDLSQQRNVIIIAVTVAVGIGVNTATYSAGGTTGIAEPQLARHTTSMAT